MSTGATPERTTFSVVEPKSAWRMPVLPRVAMTITSDLYFLRGLDDGVCRVLTYARVDLRAFLDAETRRDLAQVVFDLRLLAFDRLALGFELRVCGRADDARHRLADLT